MKFDPRIHHRRSIRLKGFDYSSAGAYFATMCVKDRECILHDPIVSGIIFDVWDVLTKWFPTIALDEFVVMPNHVHFIVWLQSVGATLAVARPDAVSHRAGASPAPTDNDAVGATLAVVRPDAVSHRAGASPAPTDNDAVGATLAVVRPDAVAQSNTDRIWTIPEPESVNLKPTLGNVVGAFKSLVFTVYLDWVDKHDPKRRAKFWQRNYHEHVVRAESELNVIRQYIRDNPLKWELDRDNPNNIKRLPPPTCVEDYLQDIGILS